MAGSEVSEPELARLRALAERSLEDDRGVDISQIRARLQLTPAERLRHMVHSVRKMRAMVEHANRVG